LSYDELLATLGEVEMILNFRPLSYISSNDTEEPLKPSHLVMGRRVLNLPNSVLCYDKDEDFTVSQDVLTKRMKYLSRILSHFWRRWRDEYLLSLRVGYRYSKGSKVARELAQGDIILMRDNSKPRGFWNLVWIENLIREADGLVRGATIRVLSRGKKTTTVRCPVTHLYPLEIDCSQEVEGDTDKTLNSSDQVETSVVPSVPRDMQLSTRPPGRVAAQKARWWLQSIIRDEL